MHTYFSKQNHQQKEHLLYLDNVILLFWQQVLLLLVPADARFDDAAEDILVAGDAWETGLHLGQYHIVCCQEHAHVMHLSHRRRITMHLLWRPAYVTFLIIITGRIGKVAKLVRHDELWSQFYNVADPTWPGKGQSIMKLKAISL